jgi:hypothetical protein
MTAADYVIAACRQTHALLAADLSLRAAAAESCAPLLSIKGEKCFEKHHC